MKSKPEGAVEERDASVDGSTAAVGSVAIALRILTLFAARSTVGVTETAETLNISRSQAHRMLATLEKFNFVSQDQLTKAYSCGSALADIALSALGGLGIGRLVAPFLQRIVEETGETAHLAYLNGRTAFFIEAIETRAVLRAGSRVGTGLPAECCSVGRAILSTRSDASVRSLYPSDKALVRLTMNSPATVADLLNALRETREQGWAVNLGDSEKDIHAVAAPILRGESEATLALACTGPAGRMPPDRLQELGAALVRIAADFSAILGPDMRAARIDRRRARTPTGSDDR